MAEASQQSVSAIILAGGRGRRMGYVDKGLVELDGKPLVEHVISRISAGVSELIISCNRNFDEYARYGTVVTDIQPGFPGPLIGILSASRRASSELCLVVPCDLPYLPENLCPKLIASLDACSAAVAHDGQHLQPLVMLVRKSVIGGIEKYLASGNRAVRGWLESLDNVTKVDFSEQAEGFDNINTPIGD